MPFVADDLKDQLQILPGETSEDAYLGDLIAAAAAEVETHIRRRLITQTVRLTMDGFGCRGAVRLPIGPVQSVVKVEYLDASEIWVTVDAADYHLVNTRSPSELHPATGASWPVPAQRAGSVRVDLVVGYGDTPAEIPEAIQFAQRLKIAAWYRDTVPYDVSGMLAPHILWL